MLGPDLSPKHSLHGVVGGFSVHQDCPIRGPPDRGQLGAGRGRGGLKRGGIGAWAGIRPGIPGDITAGQLPRDDDSIPIDRPFIRPVHAGSSVEVLNDYGFGVGF